MKVGYPDTINSSAYKQVSPLKARYTSSGEGEDLEAVELKSGSLAKKEDPSAKKQDPLTNYNDTPINMITPLEAREMSAKRIARRDERVERINAKANSIAEQAYLKGVADEDLPTTAKKKYDRLTKKADRISAKTTKSPVKNRDIIAEVRADMKAISEKHKKAEDAIRQSQSSSENTAEPTRKKTKIGIAIQARKERRAERNPKVAERQKGRALRKELNKDIKTEKARVTTARQEIKTSKTTDRLDKVKKKVDTKVTKIKSPAKFASAAQRKAVWASKNEKKKK
jgi:hypothetical protein